MYGDAFSFLPCNVAWKNVAKGYRKDYGGLLDNLTSKCSEPIEITFYHQDIVKLDFYLIHLTAPTGRWERKRERKRGKTEIVRLLETNVQVVACAALIDLNSLYERQPMNWKLSTTRNQEFCFALTWECEGVWYYSRSPEFYLFGQSRMPNTSQPIHTPLPPTLPTPDLLAGPRKSSDVNLSQQPVEELEKRLLYPDVVWQGLKSLYCKRYKRTFQPIAVTIPQISVEDVVLHLARLSPPVSFNQLTTLKGSMEESRTKIVVNLGNVYEESKKKWHLEKTAKRKQMYAFVLTWRTRDMYYVSISSEFQVQSSSSCSPFSNKSHYPSHIHFPIGT